MPPELGLPRAAVPPLGKLEVEVVSPVPPTADDLIERLYERLRGDAPRRERGPDESIGPGDEVVCDLIITVAGQLIPGGVRPRVSLEMREYPALPGLVEALVGARPHSRKQFQLTLPTDSVVETLAGKCADLQVVIHQVYEVDQPDLEDPKALNYSGLGSTPEQAMEILAQEIDEEQGEELMLAATEAVLAELGRRVRIEISDELVDSELERVFEQSQGELLREVGFAENLIEQSKQEYLLDASLREEARLRLKTEAALRAIIEQHRFAPTPEDVDRLLEAAAATLGISRQAARKALLEEDSELARSVIKSAIHLAAVEFVMSRASFKIIEPDGSVYQTT